MGAALDFAAIFAAVWFAISATQSVLLDQPLLNCLLSLTMRTCQ